MAGSVSIFVNYLKYLKKEIILQTVITSLFVTTTKEKEALPFSWDLRALQGEGEE